MNISGFVVDLLNAEVFYNDDHELKDMIKKVLFILKESGNEWKGFFLKKEFEKFLNDELGHSTVNINYHGDVEAQVYDKPLVISDLIFFVESYKI